MKKLLTILVILAVVSLGSVHAAFTTYSDSALFNAAAGSPLLTQDLETYSAGEDLDGVELLPWLDVTSNASNVEAWDSSGNISLFAHDSVTRPNGNLYYDINLSNVYKAVSFNITSWDPAATGAGTMEIFFADSTSASEDLYQTGPTESTPVFFGVISDIPMTKIRWNEAPEVGGGGNEETGLDDFTVVQECYPDLPDPELVPAGREDYIGTDSNPYTRYMLNVTNWTEYPDGLFEAAPDLPACGLNTSSSRTWVDIFAEDGTRIYGFCGLSSSSDLNTIWFAMPRGEIQPCVYITLNDRRCDITYTSNVVCFEFGVGVDIKPGSCPNPFNGKSKGSVPVAIIGTAGFDVTVIEPDSITLTTPSGDVVWAREEYEIKDSTEPDSGDPNECFDCFDADDPSNFNCDLWDALTDPNYPPVPGTDGILDSYCGDGYPDLVVKFDTRALAEAIGRVPRDTCVKLTLDGLTYDGVPIVGSDSVLTRKK